MVSIKQDNDTVSESSNDGKQEQEAKVSVAPARGEIKSMKQKLVEEKEGDDQQTELQIEQDIQIQGQSSQDSEKRPGRPRVMDGQSQDK